MPTVPEVHALVLAIAVGALALALAAALVWLLIMGLRRSTESGRD